jgi:hypothetical protein
MAQGVSFEDSTLVVLEAAFKENLEALKNGILKAIITIRNFIVSIAKKIMGVFQNLDQYIRTNGTSIAVGLRTAKEISCKQKIRGKKGSDAVTTVTTYLQDLDKSADDTAILIDNVLTSETDINEGINDFAKIKHEEMFESVPGEKIALKELNYTTKDLSDIGGNVMKGKFENTRRKAMENIKNAETIAKKNIDKNQLGKLRKIIGFLQKQANISYKVYGGAAHFVMKIAHAAQSAGQKEEGLGSF